MIPDRRPPSSNAVYLLIPVFVAGLAIGYFFHPPAPAPIAEPPPPSRGLAKLQELTENEIAEYYKLRTMEEKYAKADEILAKAVQIFVADLGLRASKQTLSQAHAPRVAGKAVDTQAPPAPAEAKINNAETPVREKAKPATPAWQNNEHLVREARNEIELKEALENSKIDSLSDVLKDARRFTNQGENLGEITGRFSGTANVTVAAKAKEWGVELNLRGRMADEKLQGRATIRMTENGKVFSNSQDRGDVQAFRELENDPQVILVRASPTIYFQMYPVTGMNGLAGNVYRQDNDMQPFAYIGTVFLRRQ